MSYVRTVYSVILIYTIDKQNSIVCRSEKAHETPGIAEIMEPRYSFNTINFGKRKQKKIDHFKKQ